jgi:NADH-quinone oxidoreductase subunit J
VITFFFLAFALLLAGCSLMVVLNRNPITSALWLVLGFVSLAGIYLLLQAEFLAMVQIIVYAGAIMVLFLFVIMYLNLKHDMEDGLQHRMRRLVGWGIGALLLAEALMLVRRGWAPGPTSLEPANGLWGNTAAIGRVLFTRYLFPFEVLSLLLLVAMVGAIVIARGPAARKGGTEA